MLKSEINLLNNALELGFVYILYLKLTSCSQIRVLTIHYQSPNPQESQAFVFTPPEQHLHSLTLPDCKMHDPVSVIIFCSQKGLHTVALSLCLTVFFTFTDVRLHLKSRLQNSLIKSGKRVSVGVCQSGCVTKLQKGFVVQGEGFVISPAS